MKRFIATAVFAISVLGIGVFVASTKAQTTSIAPVSSSEPNLKGKFVIIEKENWYIGVKENVRFASVGNKDFIVVPMSHKDGESYDHWMGLEKISGLKVFEKMEDAIAYDKKTSPR